jgi:hypothetical protein
MSEHSLESNDDHWPLVGVAFSVLATFTSVIMLLWLLSYILYIA